MIAYIIPIEGGLPSQGRPDNALPGQPNYPSNALPGSGNYPSQGPIFGGSGNYPSQGLPGSGNYPSQGPIYGGGYPSQGLPNQPGHPSGQPIFPGQGSGNYPVHGQGGQISNELPKPPEVTAPPKPEGVEGDWKQVWLYQVGWTLMFISSAALPEPK